MLTDNILSLIGNTPLVRLRKETIFAKAEFLNPGGSIKDQDSIDYCNEHGITMVLSGTRHFKH